MNDKTRSLAECTLYTCERRKINLCCRHCDGYENCNIKCMNSPEKCGAFAKI